MAKVRFSELSDADRTEFDGSGVSSPSGYNRFSKKPLSGTESKEPSVEASIAPEDSTTRRDGSSGDESDVPLVQDLPENPSSH